jgi:predicted amidohydrolase YtcJ
MRCRGLVESAALRGIAPPWALVGARVWTGDGGSAEAIAFDTSGRVLACGSAHAVLAKLPPSADVVDAGGAFVCPGFVDPHVHVRAAASARLASDVSAAVDAEAMLAAVRHSQRGHSGWITLVGSCVDSPLSGSAPDRRALDRASRGAPVRIRADNGHGWLFNSAALRRLGVDVAVAPRRELVPAGVAVERDAAGVATGFIADHVGWVRSRLGRVSPEPQLVEAVGAWSAGLARLGVVAVCDATATNGCTEADALLRWRGEGVLRQEVTFLAAPGTALLDRALRRRQAGAKFADASDSRLRDALRVARSRRLRVAVHCIEPHETAAALQAAMTVPAYARGALRIEHAAYVPPDWIDQVRRARATVVTHPSFIEQRGDAYLADPHLQPTDWLYRLGSWRRAGVPLAFASDAPFGPVDPLRALRASAARTTSGGVRVGPGEALCGEDVLAAITSEAARVAALDRLGYGRLTRGGPGAAAILTGDPRDPRALPEVELIATVIGGRVVD